MRLSEIKDKDADQAIVDWVRSNLDYYNASAIVDSIPRTGETFNLALVDVMLDGKGRPFSKPDNLKITADSITLLDFDFENSDYGNVGDISIDYLILTYGVLKQGPKFDLVKAIEKTHNVSLDTITINVKPGEFSNLIAATEISDRLNINIRRIKPAGQTVSIDTSNWVLSIGSKKFDYKDPFELQELLIDNGFEEYV
ncbi:hypothetical protein RsoM2USA_303 [Ralstonia phage RsoM2USA]|nr:hypothetical protein RsoM2USA_303 [Ralstonia phage RsoM2USA]